MSSHLYSTVFLKWEPEIAQFFRSPHVFPPSSFQFYAPRCHGQRLFLVNVALFITFTIIWPRLAHPDPNDL